MPVSIINVPYYLDHLAVMDLVIFCVFGFAATLLAHVLDLQLEDMETVTYSNIFSWYAIFHSLLVHVLILQIVMVLLPSFFVSFNASFALSVQLLL